MEVIAALQTENETKNSEIKRLQDEIEEGKRQFAKKEDEMQIILDAKIADMTGILNEKDAAFKVMQQEFAVIKDFRV